MSFEREREAAIESVLAACNLCQAVQHRLASGDSIKKTDDTPVTVADFGAQALISTHLEDVFPGNELVAEEDADILRQDRHRSLKNMVLRYVKTYEPSMEERDVIRAIDRGSGKGGADGRFWVLDPVDGTKGFLRGDQYVVALSLVERGKVVLGVLGCPNLPFDGIDSPGCLFVAVTGEGAFMRGLHDPQEYRIEVSDLASPHEAILCESVESSHSSHSVSAQIAKRLGSRSTLLRLDSQCKYAVVARGEATVYLRLPTKNYKEKIWDHAAGSIIVREAGGRVTDLTGNLIDFSTGRELNCSGGIVATNRRLHDRVLEAARETLA